MAARTLMEMIMLTYAMLLRMARAVVVRSMEEMNMFKLVDPS